MPPQAPIIPQHISPERTYEGTIDDVLKRTEPSAEPVRGSSGERGDDLWFTYDVTGVDTPDKVVLKNAAPFRRIISSDLADRPQIVAASIGDPCRIGIRGGVARLLDCMEQYIVADCQPTGPITPV